MGNHCINCSVINVSCNLIFSVCEFYLYIIFLYLMTLLLSFSKVLIIYTLTYEYRHVCMNYNWNTQGLNLHGSYCSGIIPIASPLAYFSKM